MMVEHELSKRLADGNTDIQRKAGVGTRYAAGTIEDHDMIGIAQHDVAGAGVGDDFIQVANVDILLDRN